MKTQIKSLALAGATLLAALGPAHAADVFVSATVSGVLAPGVYGRIDIGGAPPPPVLYAEPVIIARPAVAVAVPPQPLYLYVPPGHAKNWAKHCHRYNACGHPVYFVKTDNKGRYVQEGGERRGGERGDRGDRGERGGEGHGKGHGHGNKD